MKGIKVKEIVHKDYGNCLRLSNSSVTIMVSLDYGPRILHFSMNDGSNVMFFNRDPEYLKKGSDFDRIFYPGAYWNIRGGNRLWIAPHSYPHAFYPDNESVEYILLESGARFIPKPRTQIGAQLSTEVLLDKEAPTVTINQSILNISSEPKKWAAWSITSVDAGGIEIIPLSQKQTGVLPNRQVVYWPYTDIADNRIILRNRYAVLMHDQNVSAPFKIGFNNDSGWACYVNNGICLTIRYDHIDQAEYPDFGVSYETFADDRMVEMEVFSPLKILQPGESVSLLEKWNLSSLEIGLSEANKMDILEYVDSIFSKIGKYPLG